MSAGTINFDAIPLGLLRRYLKAHHWTEASPKQDPGERYSEAARRFIEARRTTEGQRSYSIFLSGSGEELVELVVPQSRDSHEYAFLVGRVVKALAALEDREVNQVAEGIRQIGFDVIQSSIPDVYVINDTIHLEKAESFIKGIRGVLASTATNEIDPKPYFLRVLKEATQYANRCRFGHTFRGSFGFTIESPLEPHDQVEMDDVEPLQPFERRVIQRLAQGLRAMQSAVSEDSLQPILESAKTGFNANVCEQLAALVENTAHAKMSFEFKYSPEWKADVHYGLSDKFVVEPRHVEAMKEAAKELRKSPPPIEATVFGRVVKLASLVDPSNLEDVMAEREVDLLWSSERLGDISVRTSLSPTDYLAALDAHRAGSPIQLSGTLEQRGRKWTLSEPKMLPPPDDEEDE